MEFNEREFLISKILSKYWIYSEGGKRFKVELPTFEINYESSLVYNDIYKNCLVDGYLSNNDVLDILKKENLYTEEKERYEDILPKHIENFKVEMYQKRYQNSKVETIRKYLKKAEEELLYIKNLKHQFDYLTCEGIATFYRVTFIFEQCIQDMELNVISLVNEYNSSLLSESQIRLLARSDPWQSMWPLLKKSNDFIKDNFVFDINKRRLILWSNLYDNANSAYEPPEDFVIEDDDLFDGWLISQNNKRKENQKEGAASNLTSNSKIANAGELFLPAANMEEAKKIYELNTAQANHNRQSRLKKVDELGIAIDKDFNDVKLASRLAKNSTEVNLRKMKGG